MLIDLKTMPSHRSSSRAPATPDALNALRRDALRDALAWIVVLAALAAAMTSRGVLGPVFAGKVLAVFALACMLALRGLPAHVPHVRFGPGNRVTLGRLAIIAGLAGCVGEPLDGTGAAAWSAAVMAGVAALLDAADGPLARAAGLESEFGARFDMECDALLTLVLCLLVFQFDKTGAWVLAGGLMRYVFVAAAAVWPWLARPLAPSQRRKVVCVAQIVGLIVCLGPVVQPWLARIIAAAGLAALAASFAADVFWLARAHRSAASQGTAAQ